MAFDWRAPAAVRRTLGRGVRSTLRSTLVVAGFWLATIGTPFAQNLPSHPTGAEESSTFTASVVVDGRTLFSLRGVSAYPAKERARLITQRIRELARDTSVQPAQLEVSAYGALWSIGIGERRIMAVADADAEVEGLADPKILAGVYRDRIARAIAEYRDERSARSLLLDMLYAALATGVFLLTLWALRWMFRRVAGYLETDYKNRIDELEARTFRVLDAKHLWVALLGFVRGIWVVALVAVVYLYLEFVLSLFPWSRPLSNLLTDWLLGPLRTVVDAVLYAIPGLIIIALIVVLTRFLLKAARVFFSAISEQRLHVQNFEADWAWPTYKIVRLVLVAFAVVVAYPYIPGSGSAAFQGITIFLGVIVSLGSSSVIANIIAGYSMIYRRAFRLGDRIKIADLIGDVEQMRLLVTHLRSLKNEEIVVPNSLILNSNVINYSKLAARHGLILHTTVGIGYEVPWRQVEAMLLLAAERTPGLMRQPAPFVLHQALGDYAVQYELNVYCDNPLAMNQLYTELHRNILDMFNEYGVQIMTPSYEQDSDQPKVVPKERWFEPPAAASRPDPDT